MQSLVNHVHAFLKEVQLQESEWWKGIEFPTSTGHMCTERRQEFILLSDTLGVSMLTDLISNRKPAGSTESTVFGPFHSVDAPARQFGDSIVGADRNGTATYLSGRAPDLHGHPIPGAELDVWQAAAEGLYDVQDPSLSEMNMRGKFRSDRDGRYLVQATRPVAYQIPADRPRWARCSKPPIGMRGVQRTCISWSRLPAIRR
jgi:protocatechuate 3,4-dioxygenase beta subunit